MAAAHPPPPVDGREPVVVERGAPLAASTTRAAISRASTCRRTYGVRVERCGRWSGAPPPTDELVRLRALEAEHARMVATVERLAATLQADHQQLSQACFELVRTGPAAAAEAATQQQRAVASQRHLTLYLAFLGRAVGVLGQQAEAARAVLAPPRAGSTVSVGGGRSSVNSLIGVDFTAGARGPNAAAADGVDARLDPARAAGGRRRAPSLRGAAPGLPRLFVAARAAQDTRGGARVEATGAAEGVDVRAADAARRRDPTLAPGPPRRGKGGAPRVGGARARARGGARARGRRAAAAARRRAALRPAAVGGVVGGGDAALRRGRAARRQCPRWAWPSCCRRPCG